MVAKKKQAKKPKSKTPAAGDDLGPCGAVNTKAGCRPAEGPCPHTVEELCIQMREYMRCMCEWAFDVATKIDNLKLRVDACCGGGGPNGVPKPPPPPF